MAVGSAPTPGSLVMRPDYVSVLTCRYAANAITLPSLDMFSNLSADDAAAVIAHLTSPDAPSALWSHWRGRYGLSSDDQASLWGRIDKESGADNGATATLAAPDIMLRFKTWDGEVREVNASEGESLLKVAKRYDLPSMEGTCGGNLGEFGLAPRLVLCVMLNSRMRDMPLLPRPIAPAACPRGERRRDGHAGVCGRVPRWGEPVGVSGQGDSGAGTVGRARRGDWPPEVLGGGRGERVEGGRGRRVRADGLDGRECCSRSIERGGCTLRLGYNTPASTSTLPTPTGSSQREYMGRQMLLYF